MMRQAEIEAAFRGACAEELAALKPGNVHIHAPGHGMTVEDFLASADVAAPMVCAKGVSLGARIFNSVSATRAKVGQNTNLGIILLCAPLAIAAERNDAPLRQRVVEIIAEADIEDAEAVFRAIALANPGGLGDVSRYDVREPARVSLQVAMAEARARDSIARQWTDGFADIFSVGVAIYEQAISRGRSNAWAAAEAHLTFLSLFPDSHVLRKHGAGAAAALLREAAQFRDLVTGSRDPNDAADELLRWDALLKARGINPGTSADLTVGTCFAWRLRNGLRSAADDG